MSPLQIAMLISATCLFVITAVLFIIRTMPSQAGIGWWLASSLLQFIIYCSGVAYFGVEETAASMIAFYCMQITSLQCISIGMMLFIEKRIRLEFRLLSTIAVGCMIAVAMVQINQLASTLIFVAYAFLLAACTASTIWRSHKSPLLLKVAATFLFLMGLHWLDFPIMGKVEWFVPIGFLLGLVLVLGVYFSLATVSLLQFKKITTESEMRAVYAANHDPLTGVYSRSYLEPLFNQYKAKVKKSQGTFMMLYLDLDGFKSINDTYGHKEGDVVLIVVTKRLKQWLGEKGDVVRIGGDEIVVLNSLRSGENTEIVYGTSAAQRILEIIEKPIASGKNKYLISASIGGCYYGPEFSEVDVMLSRSDALMYSAKQAGKRRVHFGDVPNTVSEPEVEMPKEMTAKIIGYT